MDGEVDIAGGKLAVPPGTRRTRAQEAELRGDTTVRRLPWIYEEHFELFAPLREVECWASRKQRLQTFPTEQKVKGRCSVDLRRHSRRSLWQPFSQERLGVAGIPELEQQHRDERFGGAPRDDRLDITEICHLVCLAARVTANDPTGRGEQRLVVRFGCVRVFRGPSGFPRRS